MEYELTVGLEVHIELKTENKLFCRCKNTFGKEKNSICCPVCMGIPGALPVFNRSAVLPALRAGAALNCKCNKVSSFDRKNYFYPDLPKGYQITQKDTPILYGGYLDIDGARVNIERIHLEEDAGKLTYETNGNYTVDYNRCGIPLIEIVSTPEIHSAKAAVEFLKKLRLILIYTGASDCKMQEGSMRCDVNVSVKEKGSNAAAERTEIKNASSFKFIEKAIDYEFKRQASLLEQGIPVERLTMRIDESTGKTVPMRKKEASEDYRYMPEPDLCELILTAEELEEFENFEPILPDRLIAKYTGLYNIPHNSAADIINKPEFCFLMESTLPLTKNVNGAANLITSELFRYEEIFISPEYLAELSDMLADGIISNSTAKRIIEIIRQTGKSPGYIAEKYTLRQINDAEIIEEYVRKSIEIHKKACEDYRAGNKSSIGPVMREINKMSNGLINQKIASEILMKILQAM